MKLLMNIFLSTFLLASLQAQALSLAPEEFQASRKMACVMAQQTLGQLSSDEYGQQAVFLLDGFDKLERDNILAKALGYYDGLMFSISEDDSDRLNFRLETFVASSTCDKSIRPVSFML
jgi:hypothetical protein